MFIEGRRAISSIQLEIMQKAWQSQFQVGFLGIGGETWTTAQLEAKNRLRGYPADLLKCREYYFASSFFGSFFFLLPFFFFSSFFAGSSGRANDTAARPVSKDRPSMAVINFFIFVFLLWSDDVLVSRYDIGPDMNSALSEY
jgi:hypothetical protein